jgi:hypothetical protein
LARVLDVPVCGGRCTALLEDLGNIILSFRRLVLQLYASSPTKALNPCLVKSLAGGGAAGVDVGAVVGAADVLAACCGTLPLKSRRNQTLRKAAPSVIDGVGLNRGTRAGKRDGLVVAAGRGA